MRNRIRTFPEIPIDSSLYKRPSCHTMSNTFEISKKFPLLQVMGYDRSPNKCCEQLTIVGIYKSH